MYTKNPDHKTDCICPECADETKRNMRIKQWADDVLMELIKDNIRDMYPPDRITKSGQVKFPPESLIVPFVPPTEEE